MRGAARSARPTTGAATAASGRWSRPTRRRSPAACATWGWARRTPSGCSPPSTCGHSPRCAAMAERRTRTIATAMLARVEGEGGMHVRVRDGLVDEVRLEIYEPPRFFEAFLRGRSFREVPDITARICG